MGGWKGLKKGGRKGRGQRGKGSKKKKIEEAGVGGNIKEGTRKNWSLRDKEGKGERGERGREK